MRISDWSSDLCSSDLPLSRASFAPTGIGGEHTSCCHTRTHVGAGLLAKTAAHPTCLLADPPLSRASFAPTGIGGEHTSCCHTRTPVGAGLLAKTAAHPTCLLADPPLSRASPLPQVQWCAQVRSEEHTSELQSLMRISYAVFCLKKKNKK